MSVISNFVGQIGWFKERKKDLLVSLPFSCISFECEIANSVTFVKDHFVKRMNQVNLHLAATTWAPHTERFGPLKSERRICHRIMWTIFLHGLFPPCIRAGGCLVGYPDVNVNRWGRRMSNATSERVSSLSLLMKNRRLWEYEMKFSLSPTTMHRTVIMVREQE